MAFKPKDYSKDVHNDWCAQCGDFASLISLKNALTALQIPPERAVIVSDIGCFGNAPQYINAYGFHVLHGRALVTALGVKEANPDLEVIVVAGDGGAYGIGSAHFVNTGRRNPDITYIIDNNGVFGLTKGQASPALKRGVKTKTSPPNINDAINPLGLALSSGYTFIARALSYDVKNTTDTIVKAIQHKGLALVDILQCCPTYMPSLYTLTWAKQNTFNLEDTVVIKKDVEQFSENSQDYGPYRADEIVVVPQQIRSYLIERSLAEQFSPRVSDWSEYSRKREMAFRLSERSQEEKVPLGILYQTELVSTYEERLAEMVEQSIRNINPAKADIYDKPTGKSKVDVSKILEEMAV